MKLTSRCFASLIIALCLIFAGGYCLADSSVFLVNFDSKKGVISFKGSTGASNELLSVTLLADGKELSTEEISEENSVLRMIRTGESGTFDSEIELSEKLKSGAYVLRLKGMHSGYDNSYPLSYISKTESEKAFSDMKKAVDSDDFGAFKIALTSNSSVLGINSDKVTGDDVYARIIYTQSPVNGYDIKSFYSVQRYASAISDIRKITDSKSENLDKVILAYAEDLNADMLRYKDVSGSAKEIFVDRVSGMNVSTLSKANAENFWFETMFLSEIDSCENYSIFGDVLKFYADSIGLDMDDFESSKLSDSQRNSILKNMYGKSYMSVDEVKEEFEDQVDSYLKKSDSGSSGGSGKGGGGSKGGFMSANGIEIPQDTQIPENNIQSDGYSDITNHWAKSYITALSAKGIIRGYGNNLFMPDNSITRAEFTKIICESFDISQSDEIHFDDVQSGAWYFGYVSGAYEAGIINGYNGNFNPDDLIKREDAAVIICNALKFGGKEIYSSDASFLDADDISDYALSAVGYLQSEGIMKGDNGYFSPKSNTTRAEAATLLCRILNLEV